MQCKHACRWKVFCLSKCGFVSGQTTVTINGVSLTSVSVSSSTTLTATLPTLTVGTHDLVVNNGRASATSAEAFTAIVAPTIASATISGNLVVGETLTATANTVTGTSTTLSYQWQRSNTSGGTYTAIASATNATYVLTSSDLGKFLSVIITVTDSVGATATATSIVTTVILNSCTISGDPYTANGVTYTESGTYTTTFTNAEGCVHTATLILTLGNSTNSTDNITACDMYKWPANGVTYSATGTYVYTSIYIYSPCLSLISLLGSHVANHGQEAGIVPQRDGAAVLLDEWSHYFLQAHWCWYINKCVVCIIRLIDNIGKGK